MDSGVAAVWRPADFGDPDEATIRADPAKGLTSAEGMSLQTK
ncbi:hypothetical protein [Streptomyces sp. SD15]